ncbi:MAG TPA: DNA mismatch repair endonuclease MutL [Methanoculleus sp.]|nr:DNA mismatch repair endonuclease MutL [Methanoculleus sp.]
MNAAHPDPRIRILDEETVNQIAAGEVVERPASVVKELVENAIDAGAATVRIEIISGGGGIERMRIVDDGTGMSRENVRLAFLRHATSKLRAIDDLHRIRSMGFRGEALASIAAVARVEVVTKPRGSGAVPATRLVISGGEIVEDEETGAPDGTSVAVEDLFFNTPARKKFLKSTQTEVRHMYAIMEQIALAHPDLSFRLLHNGRERIATQTKGTLLDTISTLYGSDLARDLIPVDGRTAYMQVEGLIAAPAHTRPNTAQILISVNRRQISSATLARAVREGYGTLLPKDRFPVAFLSLTIDTGLVDVNVHPTKREVRISREADVVREIASVIRETLRSARLIPQASSPPVPGHAPVPESGYTPSAGAWQVAAPVRAYHPVHREQSATDTQLRLTENTADETAETEQPGMEVIGQLDAAYIMVTSSSGDHEELILVDQHAAHERVLYEQVRAKRERGVRSQELLVPVILTLRPKEAAAVREALPLLLAEGFVLEEFGRDSFAVRTVPVVLGKQVEPEVIDDIIADVIGDELRSAANKKEGITCIIACRGAIKAGVHMTREQMARLLSQLFRTDNPSTCPHGRPTMVSFPRERLDGMFRRT